MQRLTLAGGIPDALQGSIVALGNFDGFHLGHQAVVGRAIQRGFHERRPVIVATFDPHPVRFFKPDLPPFRLTTLDQREALFAHAGADAMLVFEFGDELRSTSAEDFVTELLGEAHRRGGRRHRRRLHLRQGARRQCRAAADARAPSTASPPKPSPQVLLDGERISSGRIREALVAGDTATATRLLSRDFAIEGVVQRGDSARPRARLSDRQPRRSAITSGRATASMPCA